MFPAQLSPPQPPSSAVTTDTKSTSSTPQRAPTRHTVHSLTPSETTPPRPFRRTEIGKYVAKHTALLRHLGWPAFVKALQHPIDIAPTVRNIPHSAAPYLHRLSTNGIPAPSMATPWSMKQKQDVIRRGAHSSAKHQFRQFLWDDMQDMVAKGFWTILPFHVVKLYPHLKLAPSGVVPQRTRRPRPIMDYTFTAVNHHSAPLAPMHAMQFGSTFSRILQHIEYANPSFGHTLMAKFDLSDGYYRVPLSSQAALELAVVLPPLPGAPPLVGIPLVLPMGWKLSPPYFCAFTETAADLANQSLQAGTCLPPHPLEGPSQLHQNPQISADCRLTPPPLPHLQSKTPLSRVDVYMDDFLGLSQPPSATQTLRALLAGVHSVFRYTAHPDDPIHRKAVISEAKIAQGDGRWSTTKNILGWLVNSAAHTVHLLPHKAKRLQELLTTFLPLRRTSRRRWLQLLGELRHMATAIPGAKYLFSILQNVLLDQPVSSRLRLNNLVTDSLQDWVILAQTLTTNPTPIRSLVPAPPDFLGAVDASGVGVGGFWTTPHSDRPAMVFRHKFPDHISANLISTQNPSGTLTNSDFELAALVLGSGVLASHATLNHSHIWCASDNTPAVAWCQRGSPSSKNPNAYLLRWLASLCRAHTFVLRPVSVPGHSNVVADFCSRSFDLSEQDFLGQLQHRFPTAHGWKLVHPPQSMISEMTSALSCTRLPWDNATPGQLQPVTFGTSGATSVPASQWIPSSCPYPTKSLCCKSLPIATAAGSYLPAALKSAAARWATPFVPLGRRLPTWDILIHD
jgi:hypothetical protein